MGYCDCDTPHFKYKVYIMIKVDAIFDEKTWPRDENGFMGLYHPVVPQGIIWCCELYTSDMLEYELEGNDIIFTGSACYYRLAKSDFDILVGLYLASGRNRDVVYNQLDIELIKVDNNGNIKYTSHF